MKLSVNILVFMIAANVFASQNTNVNAYIEKALESEKLGQEKDAIGYLTTAIQL